MIWKNDCDLGQMAEEHEKEMPPIPASMIQVDTKAGLPPFLGSDNAGNRLALAALGCVGPMTRLEFPMGPSSMVRILANFSSFVPPCRSPCRACIGWGSWG